MPVMQILPRAGNPGRIWYDELSQTAAKEHRVLCIVESRAWLIFEEHCTTYSRALQRWVLSDYCDFQAQSCCQEQMTLQAMLEIM